MKKKWPRWVLLAPLLALTVVVFRFTFSYVSQYWPSCPSRRLMDFYCPGCGGTRSFLALGEAHVWDAVQHNLIVALAVLLGPVIIFMAAAVRRYPDSSWLQKISPRLSWIWGGLGMMALFTILRNLSAFSWLAPGLQ